jgi:MoxR-like ATPase
MDNEAAIQQLGNEIKSQGQWVPLLIDEIHKNIIGQNILVERLLLALLADGHILLEGMPGLAKTLAIKTLAQSCGVDFKRIQFTPDLLPADIIGTMIYNPQQSNFQVKKGPIFTNFVLADEINRAPAKVQSALLEAMQERQVTIGDQTHRLAEPFLVLATQNPIEQEGTYPLPEAQIDRFLLKIQLGYPSKLEEQMIIRNQVQESFAQINKVVQAETLLASRKLVRKIYMDERIEQYIVTLVHATRNPEHKDLQKIKTWIQFGAGPRAGIAIALAAKAHAFIKQRAYVIPEDIKAVAVDAMQHRIGLSYEAAAENITGGQIVQEILNNIQVP